LLREATVGTSTYSDLGFRLLAELLERETGRRFRELAAESSGMSPAPWTQAPMDIPDGPDASAWPLAARGLELPPRSPFQPHDANARAGMMGHAGFGATPSQMRMALERWVGSGFPIRMAVETARAEDGTQWGLGLQRVLTGTGRLGELLMRLPAGFRGIHVHVSTETRLAPEAPQVPSGSEVETEWWMHFGFTGPALFVRPRDGTTIVLLLHRRGPEGQMLDIKQLQARRWRALADLVG
jgi:CubicO group peptidase (beta-lactamase class C family)